MCCVSSSTGQYLCACQVTYSHASFVILLLPGSFRRACVYVCVYVRMYVCIYIYECMYICTSVAASPPSACLSDAFLRIFASTDCHSHLAGSRMRVKESFFKSVRQTRVMMPMISRGWVTTTSMCHGICTRTERTTRCPSPHEGLWFRRSCCR